MKNNEEVERQAEATLGSLDGLVQVEANHFMHARVMHRLQRQEHSERLFNRWLLRSAFVLLVLVGVNVVAFNALNKTTGKNQPAGISEFAGAYGLQQERYSY